MLVIKGERKLQVKQISQWGRCCDERKHNHREKKSWLVESTSIQNTIRFLIRILIVLLLSFCSCRVFISQIQKMITFDGEWTWEADKRELRIMGDMLTFMTPSSPPEASHRPSGLNRRHRTSFPWAYISLHQIQRIIRGKECQKDEEKYTTEVKHLATKKTWEKLSDRDENVVNEVRSMIQRISIDVHSFLGNDLDNNT